MARRSLVTDRGNRGAAGRMVVYPSMVVTNSRGDEVRVPDFDQPKVIRVGVATDRQSDAELIGQVSVKVLRCITRRLPKTVDGKRPDSWGRIEFRDELWDYVAPVTDSNFTRATTHFEFIIRARNEPVED